MTSPSLSEAPRRRSPPASARVTGQALTTLPTDLAPLAITDVQYEGNGGVAACVVAQSWTDATPIEEHVVVVPSVEPYRPGAFFERELPCLALVLSQVRSSFRAVVVDGYVDLDDQGKPGLGAHLHAHLGGTIPVIGVAKTSFRGSTFAGHVTHGKSRSPLFVTSRGIARADAEALVKGMHGPHRIPTLLARVDALARRRVSPMPP